MAYNTIRVRVYDKGLAELMSNATSMTLWSSKTYDYWDKEGYVQIDLTYNTNDEDDSCLVEFIEMYQAFGRQPNINIKVEVVQ